MDNDLLIFKENNLFGLKNQKEEILIPPQYIEMQPFSCGLSLVRNSHYQYAYINTANKQVVSFGKYSWCDPQFVCGYARVKSKDKWGIIDTLGNIVVPLEYDKIWPIREDYIFSIKAFIGDDEHDINLKEFATDTILDGLKYIKTYAIEEFKTIFNCSKLNVKSYSQNNQLYFTYGCNIGQVAISLNPKSPVVAIVTNSSGNVFPLLMESEDIGKTYLSKPTYTPPKKTTRQYHSKKTSFLDYETEKMNDTDNWSDPYGYEQDYYDGWNREDVDSGLADAFEGDESNYWNIN